MILIDLLPAEYRQKKRTPIKFMATVVAAVAINSTLIAYWSWTAFGVAAEVKSELSILRDTHQGLQGQVAYHKSLEQESTVFKARENMLGNVTSKRVSWTRQVDVLIDIINRGGDGEKYIVWMDDLQADMKENPRTGTFGQLKAKGHSGSANFAQVANFLEDVEESELMDHFTTPGRPEGAQSSVDEDLMPAEVWTFPLEIALKAPEARRHQ